MFKTLYNKFWDWCKNSGTILYNRMETFAGFLVAVLGSLDWSSLLSYSITPSYNWQSATILGGTLMLKGIVGEVIRRHNTVESNNKLIPAEITKSDLKAVEAAK